MQRGVLQKNDGLTIADLALRHHLQRIFEGELENFDLFAFALFASAYVIAPCKEATGIIVDRSVSKKDVAAFEKLGLSVLRA